ncbi:MAG: thioesterase domain-containing protein [Paracoccus sp. (in: a-proteobacteria)]|uniref:thioesterase II family protein n=1 Tax=Paracoccus sp. TaxID=267 RepID=UPI0026DEF0D9|nr:thioesterase domain-containing protein [Paracoccus sp. (in: a-proteobacteria)]MDO5611875.1 thioesterase domain-containing protein [Paracoccus sp. (in: a-proteobacteria)]
MLICLPPAGAGPSIFRPWQRDDPGICAPQIPGRETLFRDPPAPDLPRLADRIALAVAPTLPASYAVFGYSMGGTVAYLLARRLMRMGRPAPQALFLLGASAPDRLHQETAGLLALDSAGFWAEIARLGGTPDAILADPELRDLFEPALRHDFGLCARHRDDGDFRLPCPVHVFVAADDPLVGDDSVQDWARFTTGMAYLHPLPGRHMLDAPAFAALLTTIRRLSVPVQAL